MAATRDQSPSWHICLTVLLILVFLEKLCAQNQNAHLPMQSTDLKFQALNQTQPVNVDRQQAAEPLPQEVIDGKHLLQPNVAHIQLLNSHDGFQEALPDKFENNEVKNEQKKNDVNPIVRDNMAQIQNISLVGIQESSKVDNNVKIAEVNISNSGMIPIKSGMNLLADSVKHNKSEQNVNSNFNVDKSNNILFSQNISEQGMFDIGVKRQLNTVVPDTNDFERKDKLLSNNNHTSQTAGKIPDHVKFIDGDVEKIRQNDTYTDDEDDDKKEDENDAGKPDSGVKKPVKEVSQIDSAVISVFPVKSNEIPTMGNVNKPIEVNNNKLNVNENSFINVPAVDTLRNNVTSEEKLGSLKVVWDWSDFAVNFEQYVMPEQKIRRAPHATTGEPWPLPQYYVSNKEKVYKLEKNSFRFKLLKVKCDIIERAIERYRQYILEDAVEDMYDNFQHAQSTMFEEPSAKYDTQLYLEAPLLATVQVKIRKPCAKYPTADMDESYDLFVKKAEAQIWANEVWGALRGLETFSQLVFKGTDQMLYIQDTVINDYPRFPHRGILIDSSRHFIFKETIYDVLEGMSQNKMNVLHWHIVDDQSFPYYSNAYPDLSAKGAFHPTFVYMPDDIADIIEFARLRGIRVEPEFDTPGHTYSWGLSRSDLLTQCYQAGRQVDGYLGPMDPSKNETFRFLKNFFKDVLHTFKDQYLHLGGDEVPMTCWQSNPEIIKFLAQLDTTKKDSTHVADFNVDPSYYSYDMRKVLEYYVSRLITDLKSVAYKRSNGLRLVFWQEVMNNNVQLPNDTIIQVWQGGMEEVERAISLGMNVIYSTCWYLDLIEYGTKWSKYYHCDPADNTFGYSVDETKVLGGEACLWAEYIDNENLMTTLWPRASATAERLWSNKEVRDLDTAASRLQEHRCRMLGRGLGVGQISGPDYCLRRGRKYHHVNETISNCTLSHCVHYSEVEKIKVEFEQKGTHMSDCSQAVLQVGSQVTLVLILLAIVGIGVTLIFTKKKVTPVRICKNKTILITFVALILIYFMCYTSIWMQAMEFKGSIEKQKSSNLQNSQHDD